VAQHPRGLQHGGPGAVVQILPRGLSFDAINQDMPRRHISRHQHVLSHGGLKGTVVFSDQLMYTGFHYATRAGVSIGVDDMVVPSRRSRFCRPP